MNEPIVNSQEFRGFFADQCLHQVFEAQAAQRPYSIAISYGEIKLTYHELNVQANQLARHLQTLGVGPEVLVGLCVERSIDAIIGMLGILKAGGAYVPLDPAYPQDRLTYMLQDTQIPVLITRADTHTDMLPPGLQPLFADYTGQVVYLDKDKKNIGHQPSDNLASGVSPDNLMYVIYTSGSTGKPKGIMVTHANVLRLFPATQPYLAFDEKDVWTLFHSYSFGFSVWEIWGALFHGARLVVVPPAISQSPDDFYKLVRREQVTVLSQTPSAFSLFRLADAAAKQSDGLALRYIVFSGEALESTLLESWIERHGDEHPQLINMYAITETAGEITYRRLTVQDLHQDTRSVIGVPLPDVQIYLLDEDKQPVSKGDPGEMYVSSPAVARGYLNLPELTMQKFMSDPYSPQEQVQMYRTGDQARYLSTGEIEFLGRVDDQVKIRGYRVEPSEIQARLARHPGIAETVVTAQSDLASTNRLVAYIVPQPLQLNSASLSAEAELTTATLQNYLKTDLPDYMIPSVFVKLDRLPRSPNGKIDRQMLPRPEHMSDKSTTGYVAQNAEEKALAQMWGLGSEPAAPIASVTATPIADAPVEGVLLQNSVLESAYVAPQTPAEKALAQIWGKVLGRPNIGLYDDFLAIGGNSLLAAQILYQMNDEFNVNLSMRQLLDTSTVAGLMALITQEQAAQVETEELADILADLAKVSDREVQQLLAQQTEQQTAVTATYLSTVQVSVDEIAQHETYMRLAIDKAKEAVRYGQNPIAACIVKDRKVIACVYNGILQNMDVTAHAEMEAIREACRQLKTIDLSGCVLYSTLEPCTMCFSASQWANIDRIVYGARIKDIEQFDWSHDIIPALAIKDLDNSSVELIGDILRDENIQILEQWLNAKDTEHTQYDEIAQQFKKTKISPVNQYIFTHTLLDMIGEVDGKSVLDLACGEGHYSRLLKQHGATQVVGVDISSEMVMLAKQQEVQQPTGIQYICEDLLKLGTIGEFDLVIGGLVLNHAKTKDELTKMCRTAFNNLKVGGYFILLNENPEQLPEDFQGYEQYGYKKIMAMPYDEGDVITYTLYNGVDMLQFTGHYWLTETYEMAFKAAGFGNVQWCKLLVSPEGITEYGHRFWRSYIDNPPHIGIICRKGELS